MRLAKGAIDQEFLRNLLQGHVSGSQHQFEVVQNVSVVEDQLLLAAVILIQ